MKGVDPEIKAIVSFLSEPWSLGGVSVNIVRVTISKDRSDYFMEDRL